MSAISDTVPHRQTALPAVSRRRILAAWLFFNASMVLAMAVIGAITRLTESGLSITVWQPLIGWQWPATPEQWQAAFELYRQTPQYQQVFAGMSLSEFKTIFFWEWFHRLWGRLIGLTFAVPLLFFALRGWIRRAQWPPILGLLALGGLQGFMGWYMVQSGLVERVSVSHYRLAAHLGLALLIFAALVKVGLGVLRPAAHSDAPTLGWRGHLWGCLAVLAVTIVWGAFVAGLDAGLIYNSFPLMGGGLLPSEAWFLSPAWLNALENHATVQFIHRWLGIATALAVLGLWRRARRFALPSGARQAVNAAAFMVVVQVTLGIATLLSQVALPLGAAHQAGAILLLGSLVWVLHETRRQTARTVASV